MVVHANDEKETYYRKDLAFANILQHILKLLDSICMWQEIA